MLDCLEYAKVHSSVANYTIGNDPHPLHAFCTHNTGSYCSVCQRNPFDETTPDKKWCVPKLMSVSDMRTLTQFLTNNLLAFHSFILIIP